MTRAVSRSPRASAAHRGGGSEPGRLASWTRGGGLSALLFGLPMLVLFAAFSWYPIGRAIIMAFEHTNLGGGSSWVGLSNFVTAWHDPLAWKAARNTAYYAFLALLFGFPVPIVAAVLISEMRRNRALTAALVYFPVIVPPVVGVLLWKFFYNANASGLFNTVLGWVHLGPYPWIQSASSAMPSLVLEATWAYAGGTVVIYLAAITGVNTDLYEAASLDGASVWRKIFHITLPQLRGVILVMMILQIIATAQIFTEPFVFTGGGPSNSTLTILLYIYQLAFGNSVGASYGEATALSLMLAIFLAIFSLIYLRLTRSWSNS